MDQKIIDELAKVLKQDAKTHAMWIKGSVAEGFADELSDVDLMIGIDEGCDDEVYSAIESFLRAQDDLAVNFDARQSFSKHSHKVYRLAQSNPYHFIEVTLLPHSGQVVFTEGVDKVKTLFDKDGSIKFKPLDNQKLQSELLERSRYLKEKIKIGELFVKKEITRRQYMDAMHNYQFWLVEPVIELARIKYAPLKISYGLKHGSRDLPTDIVKKIASLYTIKSLDDLKNKIEEIKVLVLIHNS